MNQPLLSIVVPTYNRSVPLHLLLSQLSKECESFNGQIEIVIGNNNSTDNTGAVLDNFVLENENNLTIRIFTQPTNIAVSKHFRFIIAKANGLFTWIIPDDDYLTENKFGSILQVLKRYEYDILFLRTTGIGEWDKIKKRTDQKLIEYSGIEDDYAEIIYAATFCSSSIFRSSPLKEKMIEAERYDDTCYPQWYCVLSIVEMKSKFLFYNDTVVLGNFNMIGPSEIRSTFVLAIGRLIVWNVFKNTQAGKLLRKTLIKIVLIQWCMIILGRANDIHSLADFKQFIRQAVSIFGLGKIFYNFVLFVSYILYLPQIIKRKFKDASVKSA